MKKNIYKLAICAALFMTTSACDEFLEPEIFSEIGQSNFFLESGDVDAVLIASYDQLQRVINDRHWDWGEARSDNFRESMRSGAGDEQDLLDNNIGNAADSADWGDLYNAVANANLVIDRGPEIEGVSDQVIGEAHAIRAFTYFHMVRIWGDVPAVVMGIENLEGDVNLPRTDLNTIISDIIMADIDRAEALITAPASPQGRGRFNIGSVLALKAHVYAWLGGAANWQIASDSVDELSSGYALTTTREEWRDMFTEAGGNFGPELIFSILFDFPTDGRSLAHDKLNDGSLTFMFSQSLGDKWIEKFPIDSTAWVTTYPGFPERTDIGVDENDSNFGFSNPLFGDWRLRESAQFDQPRFSNSRTMLKYVKQRNNDNGRDISAVDYPIYRYAGLMLLKAEMQVQLGNNAAAVAIVNEIRTARELPLEDVTNFTNATDALNLVLDERQFELYGEAHRWWDLRRNDLVFDTVLNDGTSETDDENNLDPESGTPLFSRDRPGRLLWPIGNRVITLNTSISAGDQNPDY